MVYYLNFKTQSLSLLILLFLTISSVKSQVRIDTLAAIEMKKDVTNENTYHFTVSNEPPLHQIAGAPETHYSYFWEFGDGNYSFDKKPTHQYTDPGKGNVVISLTNNYSHGGVPRIRQKKRSFLKDNKKVSQNNQPANKKKKSSPLASNESIKLFTNHSPRPGDPMVCVLSYQNNEDLLPVSGTVYLFYNEKAFGYENFQFEESRSHYGEIFQEGLPQQSISFYGEYQQNLWASLRNPSKDSYGQADHAFLESEPIAYPNGFITNPSTEKVIFKNKKEYKDVLSWKFDKLTPGEQRNIFTTFLTTKEMVKDTTANMSFKAVVIPDYKTDSKEYKLKMTVQSSHDPNKLYVSDKKIRKKHIRKHGITYTVKFQNVGKGEASNIIVENNLHKSLDPTTIELVDFYPRADFCKGDSTLIGSCLDTLINGQQVKWKFSNVYLPGTRQDNRESRKATKGWVEFTVKPRKSFRRKNVIKNRANIYFDRNKPIRTNKVSTKVVKSTSFGIKGGFNNISNNTDDILAGIVLAPYRPKGFYYQAEVMLSGYSYQGFERIIEDVVLFRDANGRAYYGDVKSDQSLRLAYLDFVPLQIRKNFTPFLSIGAGLQVSYLITANEKITSESTYHLIRSNPEPPFPTEYTEYDNEPFDRFHGIKDERFSDFETGYFLDIHAGFVV